MQDVELSRFKIIIYVLLSLALVAFGQPAWSSFLAILCAIGGYALFWRTTLCFSNKKQRFLIAFAWFSTVQLIQLSWFLSHPFAYIYGVWIFFSLAVGAQFGLLSLLIASEKITSLKRIFTIASCWTLMEWSRLFFLSGYSWNPVGLALAGNVYSLQFASTIGVYGLSFLVILINLLVLRSWLMKYTRASVAFAGIIAAIPFLFGMIHYSYHEKQISMLEKDPSSQFSAILVQTAFPVEESMNFTNREQLFAFVLSEWKQMLKIIAKNQGTNVQLIAFPEIVVPYGTYTFVYDYEDVKNSFLEAFGPEIIKKLPPLKYPIAYQLSEGESKPWLVNNAYWAQALADIFDASVVIGLEDAEDVNEEREYYSSAIHVIPESRRNTEYFQAQRYSKRVLVPMGEYIPFTFCRDFAARYGVFGSFAAGKKAEVWNNGKGHFGLSICYEEMFGNLMRESRQDGANILLNITSDAWFPDSKLIRQHLEHSRLRTVENGIPLLRACNTGVTCGIDSIGRDIALLGEDDRSREHLSDSLHLSFPLYGYQTLYTRFGDGLIVSFSSLCILLFFRRR